MKDELIQYIQKALLKRLYKMSVNDLKRIFIRLVAEKDVLIEANK